MSESISWETCPICLRPAAVGWRNGRPVEFDCPARCRLDLTQLSAFAERRRPVVEWLTRHLLDGPQDVGRRPDSSHRIVRRSCGIVRIHMVTE